MKGVFGILVLAAGQAVYVSALAVPSLFGRQESSMNISTIDLATIVGTLNLSATPDATSTFCMSSGMSIPTALVVDNSTDTATDVISTTSSPTGTVTVTVTDVQIITADPVTTTTATDSFVTVSLNGGQFGGQVGQAIAESAPTGGAVITIGAESAFGGVVGVLQASPSTSTVFITATAVVTVIASPDNATVPVPTDSLAPQGDGAFGGTVGSQVFVSNLVSTASAFSGFGGIAGFVSASPETSTALETTVAPETTTSPTPTGGYYYKRAAFTTAVNVTASQTGITIFPRPSLIPIDDSATTATDTGVVVVTVVTTVEPTVTLGADEDAGTASSSTTDSDVATATGDADTTTTSSSTTDNGIETATAVVTATFTAAAASPTILAPFSLAQVFPDCANGTDTLAALATFTIPDMVLPSNLTLSQVLGFFGGQANCTDLFQLLGVGTSGVSNSTSLVQRNFVRGKRSGLR